MNRTTIMKTITRNGFHYNDQGHLVATKVTILDLGDQVTIGNATHNKSDLQISDGEITPIQDANRVAPWSVKWDT